MSTFTDLKSKESREKIEAAIKQAELNTSGEIRVHIESSCKIDPYLRAAYIFIKLNMLKTEQRNAVLVYVAPSSHHFAIVGDSGINSNVGAGFWNSVTAQMSADFKEELYVQGICKAVLSIGEKLKLFFPYQTDDINEQHDEVSFQE